MKLNVTGIELLGPEPGQLLAWVNQGMYITPYVSIYVDKSNRTCELQKAIETKQILGLELTNEQHEWLKNVNSILVKIGEKVIEVDMSQINY